MSGNSVSGVESVRLSSVLLLVFLVLLVFFLFIFFIVVFGGLSLSCGFLLDGGGALSMLGLLLLLVLGGRGLVFLMKLLLLLLLFFLLLALGLLEEGLKVGFFLRVVRIVGHSLSELVILVRVIIVGVVLVGIGHDGGLARLLLVLLLLNGDGLVV